MKLLISIFLFISLNTLGQTNHLFLIENIDSLNVNKVDWSKVGKQKRSTKDKEIVRNALSDTTHFLCTDITSFELFLSDFHFVDIDDDADFDLIYNGRACPGYESEFILVYINNDGVYDFSLFHNGVVLSLHKNELIFYQYPCCAEVSRVYSVFKTKKDSIYLDYNVLFYSLPEELKLKKSHELIVKKDQRLDLFSEFENEVKTANDIKSNSFATMIHEGKKYEYVLFQEMDITYDKHFMYKNFAYYMYWVSNPMK